MREACFSSTYCPNGQPEDFAQYAGRHCTTANLKICGHGTHVAAIALSADNKNKGMAPEAKYIPIQIFSQFDDTNTCTRLGQATPCILTRDSDMIAALDWLLRISASYPIASVNMSLGGGKSEKCPNSSLAPFVKALREEGIATVIAAGNGGWTNFVSHPGCILQAITVSATTTSGVNTKVASFF